MRGPKSNGFRLGFLVEAPAFLLSAGFRLTASLPISRGERTRGVQEPAPFERSVRCSDAVCSHTASKPASGCGDAARSPRQYTMECGERRDAQKAAQLLPFCEPCLRSERCQH